MVVVVLSIEGSLDPAVQLEPDIIYRIGRRSGLEFTSEDKSMELAHATIALISGGIVRLAAVAGKIFVNGQETQSTSISEADVPNGFLDLRFGNVKAKLRFEDTISEAAQDSSGYDDNIKEKSSDVTPDSLNIPETEPPSINNTVDGESFNIPETQAVSFSRPFKRQEEPRISLGEDFLIPETQEVLIHDNNPVMAQQADEDEEDEDASELGTQIRICTQEFNEFPGDAIDDFDSSLLIDDVVLAIPTTVQTSAVGYDLEMSALNWSASNSKCTALNSTKHDAIASRSAVCVTPDLSLTSKDLEDVRCTPDLFELLDGTPNKITGDCTPDHLDEPTPTESEVDTQQLCSAKQPEAVNIETPEPTQTEPENDIQDFIETQAFPMRNANKTNDNIQDFIETQAFPKRNASVSVSKPAENNDNIQDFIETQAFEKSRQLQLSSPKARYNVNLNNTEALPKRNSFLVPPLKSQLNKSYDHTEDFVATQAFIRPSRTPVTEAHESEHTSFVTTASIHNTTEDMMETQLFVHPVEKDKSSAVIESEKDRLDITDSLNIGDEFDQELEQFIALGATANTPSDDEEYRLTQPAVEQTGNDRQKENSTSTCEKGNEEKEQSIQQLPPTTNDITSPTSSGAKAVPENGQTLRSSTRPFSYLYFSDSLSNALSCASSPAPGQNLESLTKETLKKSGNKKQFQEICRDKVLSDEKQIVTEKELFTKNEGDSSSRQETTKKTEKTSARKRKKPESEPNQPLPIKKTRIQQISEPPETAISPMSIRMRRKRSTAGLDTELATTTKKGRSENSLDVVPRSDKVKQSITEDVTHFKKVQVKVLVKDEKLGKQLISDPKVQEKKEDTKAASSSKERNVRSNKSTKVDDNKPEKKGTRSRRELPNKEIKTKEKDIQDIPVSSRRTKRSAANTGSEEATSATKEVKSTSRKAANKKETVEEKPETNESPSEATEDSKATNSSKAKTTKGTAKDVEKDAKKSNKTKAQNVREKKLHSESQTKVTTESSKSSHQPAEAEPTNSHRTRKQKQSQETIVKTVEEISTSRSNTRAKNTLKSKGSSEDQNKDINGHADKPSSQTKLIDKEPATSQNTRRNSTRLKLQSSEDEPKDEHKDKLSSQDQLKDINDYIKNIKRSSRKIQLTLTMCNIAEIQPVLNALKNVVVVAEDPLHCDLLIMDKGERTYKFLVGVAANKPILSTSWLRFMKETRSSVVRAEHIFNDNKFEQSFKFKPLTALEYPNLLKDINFMLGSVIQPSAVNMKAIIESAGGIVHSEAPLIANNTRLYVVISNADKQKWPLLKTFTNVQYIKTEGVMQALVQHKTELLDEHRLKL